MPDWKELQVTLGPQLFDYGTRVAGVLVLFFVAWILAGWMSRIVSRGFQRGRLDETLSKFTAKLVRWLVLLLALLACLSVLGIETTSFAAVLGAAGLAVGLAFQDTLSNIAAGVMLLVFRPFSVGQFIEAAGQRGTVDEIGLFTTSLNTPDNRRLILPNQSVIGTAIENVSYNQYRRAEVNVGVSYSADIDATRDALTKAVNAVHGRLDDPAPAVVLMELGASSVDWSVRVWASAADFLDVRQATVRSIKMVLDEAGIEIPFPQMDVHLEQPPVL
jgi:small conductance mechanosensitive channel